jgi:hypothetical protein
LPSSACSVPLLLKLLEASDRKQSAQTIAKVLLTGAEASNDRASLVNMFISVGKIMEEQAKATPSQFSTPGCAFEEAKV